MSLLTKDFEKSKPKKKFHSLKISRLFLSSINLDYLVSDYDNKHQTHKLSTNFVSLFLTFSKVFPKFY
jgi:hypothetical protein